MHGQLQHDTEDGRAVREVVGPTLLHDIPNMVGDYVPSRAGWAQPLNNLEHHRCIMQNSFVERGISRVELED